MENKKKKGRIKEGKESGKEERLQIKPIVTQFYNPICISIYYIIFITILYNLRGAHHNTYFKHKNDCV